MSDPCPRSVMSVADVSNTRYVVGRLFRVFSMKGYNNIDDI